MARKGFCASCGREVWLGRDGGCQFGHPASQMSNVHEATPGAAAPAASAMPVQAAPAAAPLQASAPAPAPAAPAPRPFVPPPPLDAPAPVVGTAAVAVVPAAEGAWGNSPDDFTGSPSSSFDYMALSNDTSIGDTDCLTKRAVARIIDNILLNVVIGIVTIPVFLGMMSRMEASRGAAAPSFPGWLYPFALLVQFAYFMVLPSVWKGRTLGKAAVGIAVTDMHDHAPTVQQLLIRELAMIADGLLYGIVGLVIASKSPRTQRLGDQWAQTVVVRTR